MSHDRWNPEQYARFRDERSQPFYDLLSLVQQQPEMRVADLGCGPGELTRHLHDQLHAQRTVGVDSSSAMLSRSAVFAGNGVSFENADMREFAARETSRGAFDLVLSNAALQWVPEQPDVLKQLASMLAPHGQLAFQVPANEDHASHAIAREVVAESPFRELLGGYVRIFSNLAPDAYAELLDALGFVEQHVRLQVYAHHLESRTDVIEWIRGSLLTDYQRRLSPEQFETFLEQYRARLLPKLADRRPFLYPFKRILVWGRLS